MSAAALLLALVTQADSGPRYLTTGLFIASIEEGARIFTPARLLPFEHPEALGHQFPTVQQLHGGEDQVLLIIGQAAGYGLATTLERYPTQPDTLWPYAPFAPPPVAAIRAAPVIARSAVLAPLPGLRALAVVDRFPVGFIVDTRGLSLAERHMDRATSMGLDVTRAEFLAALTRAAQAAPATGAAVIVFRATPPWIAQLGYSAGGVYPVRCGAYGMPFVDVVIAGDTLPLVFDTGDMAGLTLATAAIDRLHLPEVGRWDRLDSGGRVIGQYRRVHAVTVTLLGRALANQTILEFSDAVLGGLVGPDALPGARFTLDYRAELLAVADAPLTRVPAGFIVLPLVHSARQPRLILAMGRVNGRLVLIEFDTGASRTNIDPRLVQELGLPQTADGVRIDSLALGPLVFTVPSAKVNSKAGIDPTLTPPLLLAVGSDILSQLIVTVDYGGGRMFLLDARRP